MGKHFTTSRGEFTGPLSVLNDDLDLDNSNRDSRDINVEIDGCSWLRQSLGNFLHTLLTGQTRDLSHSCCNFGCTPLYPLGSRIQPTHRPVRVDHPAGHADLRDPACYL